MAKDIASAWMARSLQTARAAALRQVSSFRTLVVAGGVLLATFAVICGLVLMQAYEETRITAEQSAMNLAQAISRDVTRNIEIYDLALQDTADAVMRPEITGLSPDLRKLVLFHRSTTERYLGATILIDTRGDVTDRSDDSANAVNVRDRDYFVYHRDHPDDRGLRVSAPFTSRVDAEPSVAVSRVLRDDRGAFAGVVACVIHLDYFQALFAKVNVGAHGIIALMNANGTLLMRKPLDPGQIGSDVRAITRNFDAGGVGTFMARSPLDGLNRAYVYQRAANAPLVTLIGTSSLDVFGAWSRKALAFGVSLVVLIGAGVGIAALLRVEMRRRHDAEQERLQSEARFRLLAERSSDAIALRDANGLRIFVSPSFYPVIGWTPEALGRRPLMEILHPDDRHVLAATPGRLFAGEGTVAETFRLQRQDGSWIWLESRTSAVFDAGGAIVNLISNLRDISAQKAAEEDLVSEAARYAVLATTDKLTGLANRRRFDEALEQEWRRAVRNGATVALLLIDADNFKLYNDRHGHQRGDAVLQAIATCIMEGVRRPGDLGARYGGEEFAVLLPETTEAQALMLAERVRLAVAGLGLPHPETPAGHVTISVGAACLRADDRGAGGELVAEADAALYAAKRQGKNRSLAASDIPASASAAA